MGKRSNFERRERNFYPTPPAALSPLIPHLSGGRNIVEPCAGDGSLVRALKERGYVCDTAFDIEPMGEGIEQLDALSDEAAGLMSRLNTMIVTNPPWSRDILHPMIERFSSLAPTWLLFDADWAYTKQARPYQSILKKIVVAGRVKWFPDSKMTGKDNCAWYFFDNNSPGYHTQFWM